MHWLDVHVHGSIGELLLHLGRRRRSMLRDRTVRRVHVLRGLDVERMRDLGRGVDLGRGRLRERRIRRGFFRGRRLRDEQRHLERLGWRNGERLERFERRVRRLSKPPITC